MHVQGSVRKPHARLVQGVRWAAIFLLLAAMPASAISAEQDGGGSVEDPLLSEQMASSPETDAREAAGPGAKQASGDTTDDSMNEKKAATGSEKPLPVNPASEKEKDEGEVKEVAEKLDAASLVDRCIVSREKLIQRLQRLHEDIERWREKHEQELRKCRQQLAAQKQQVEKKVSVWRRMVSEAVKRWIARNVKPEDMRLLGCERFEEPRLDVRGDTPVLILSGRVRDPETIERHFEGVQQLFPRLELDTETLRGVAGECSLSIGSARVEEGTAISMVDYEELPMSALSTLPTKEDCISGQAGRDLQLAIEEGRLQVEGGKVTDFWMNDDGDFALCMRLEDGWYIQKTGLEGFAGLFLGRRE